MPLGHLPVRSYLAIPVTSRTGKVIGGLFFGHSQPGRFAERHERLLVGVAGQGAVAIDNAQLFEKAQREIAERLNVSENTVKTHSSRLFEKLGARRRTQAVQLGKQQALIP